MISYFIHIFFFLVNDTTLSEKSSFDMKAFAKQAEVSGDN